MPGRAQRIGLAAAIAVAAGAMLLLGAWGIDSAVHAGQVLRNVEVGDEPVGGLHETELTAVISGLAERSAARPVTIATPAGTLETNAAAVGIELDVDATVDAAMAARRGGSILVRPFSWLRSIASPDVVHPRFVWERSTTEATTAELAAVNRVDPTEPQLEVVDGDVRAVPGRPGSGLDLDQLSVLLLTEATAGDGGAIEVELSPTPLLPAISDAEARAGAERAQELTDATITIEVAGASAQVGPEELRSWVAGAPDVTNRTMRTTMDVAAMEAGLVEAIGDVGTPATQLSWQIDTSGAVSWVPGASGTACCAADSGARVAAALEAGAASVRLDLRERPPLHDAEWAASMQITTPVATFTTPHACCEGRVANIQRIADLVRGVVIEPGASLSINDFVGRRTAAKGFVEAGVIYAGEFTTDVGGGVSQFATTLFNAAFFAGLEIPEYMAHTIYISRYPYGREATLSYPEPDLVVTNNTPFGVLVWPTYTGTSITVTLYSSPWIVAEQTGQSEAPSGACKRVTTQRTRTWLVDGHTETDAFHARYQPEEGVLC